MENTKLYKKLKTIGAIHSRRTHHIYLAYLALKSGNEIDESLEITTDIIKDILLILYKPITKNINYRDKVDVICNTFHLFTLDELAVKYKLSKYTVSKIITDNFFQNKELIKKVKIDLANGLKVNQLVEKYNISYSRAYSLSITYKPSDTCIYFGAIKEPIYNNEDEMIIQEYKPSDLTGWEAETYNAL